MDKYANFRQLSENETEGVDFRVATRMLKAARTAVVAPHGGAIEPGTTEFALSVVGSELNYATFEGLKVSGNRDLHITSFY
ncbi:MAG: poly-gamma-glutamate hydrolase family protein, partial [Gammaproteobacteria bacterium]|nr:poly-gamma-glutamate hydrolase family protein [Gammaproteobacteria bacterium]